MDHWVLILGFSFAFLVAGTVKGISGLGLPMTALGLITLFVDPRTAVSLILLPMIITNAWQLYRLGEIVRAVKSYWPFAVVLCLVVGVTPFLFGNASDRLLYGVTGMVLLMFVAVNLSMSVPAIPNRFDKLAQVIFGLAAGVMGGLTAVWAPPVVVYLTARRVSKDEFVRASGLLIFIGSIPLSIGYIQQGYLTGSSAGVSLAMLAPTMLGFTFGERIRNRLPAARFRQVLLFLFLGFGLNLLRKAFF